MTTTRNLTAADVRSEVGHPIVDADGHFMEFMPLVDDEVLSYLEEAGGPSLPDRFRANALTHMDTAVFETDRSVPAVVDAWRAMPSWWGNPVSDPRERATAHLPQLMYDRLEELGIDFMLIYPSWTLGFLTSADDELRAPTCRATNRYFAKLFAPYRDRLEPGALIPMQNPDEAVAEIDFAVQQLGFKSVVLAGHAFRPVGPKGGPPVGSRLDVFGLDSPYDYDPVWAACVRNKVAPAFHSSLQQVHPARSITNYVFNHVNGIAGAHEALCKALFLGGVYRRFPDLHIGFLEGGVTWGCSLLADLIGHWDKRGGHAIDDLDPARLDVAAVLALVQRYGSPDMIAKLGELDEHLSRRPGRPAMLDEFAAAAVSSVEDIIKPFETRLYFGCEADDPLISFGFHLNFEGREVTLRPMLGSDVSHWDAPVMSNVMVEAYELVERGSVTPEQFEQFTFTNPVRLHTGANPRFFEGTVCEREAAVTAQQ
jgi:predicted TIM-barrel fold metal-dependent hydrolase